MEKNTKLNFGCNQWKLKGFINIDKDEKVKPDIVMDIKCPLQWEDNSIDEIYCGHFIEHLNIDEALDLIKECYRILKPTGQVIFTIPDYQKIFNEMNFIDANKTIMSNQANEINGVGMPIDPHKSIWSKNFLEMEMIKLGFVTEIVSMHEYTVANVNWQTIVIGKK